MARNEKHICTRARGGPVQMSGDGIDAEEQPIVETRNDGQPSEVYLVQISTTFHFKFNYYIYISGAIS
jgi:hypothetical protein